MLVTTSKGPVMQVELVSKADAIPFLPMILDRVCSLLALLPDSLEADASILLRQHPSNCPILSTSNLLQPLRTDWHLDSPMVDQWYVDFPPLNDGVTASTKQTEDCQELSMQDTVDRIWEDVFSINGTALTTYEMHVDTPFYEIWGNMFGGAQLQHAFRKRNVSLSNEEIIRYPTRRLQRLLLSRDVSLNIGHNDDRGGLQSLPDGAFSVSI